MQNAMMQVTLSNRWSPCLVWVSSGPMFRRASRTRRATVQCFNTDRLRSIRRVLALVGSITSSERGRTVLCELSKTIYFSSQKHGYRDMGTPFVCLQSPRITLGLIDCTTRYIIHYVISYVGGHNLSGESARTCRV